MTRTEFENLAFFWGLWTFFEAMSIAVLWQSRSRVLGNGVYRIRGVRRVGRGACERRVEALLAELERRGVPEDDRPDKGQLVERWHRTVVGRCVSVLLQAVPFLAVVLPFWWATSFARTMVTPFWMFAAITAFGVVSITLMAADERATAVSDPAGGVTVKAIHFLEALLIPAGRRAQDSALDIHGNLFGRLCNALRAQARHGTRTMPPATRARVRETTERLVGSLAHGKHPDKFGEGPDREAAVRDLSRLVAGALRRSCRPRAQRDSLVIVDSRLLADAREPDEAGAANEPLRSRLLAGAGRLAVAVGLLVGAFLFPGGGVASGLLMFAGLAIVAKGSPLLREGLNRAGELFLGGSSPDTRAPEPGDEEPSRPLPAPPAPCPNCADRSPVTAGSRSVG
ncbi:hypothetical protein ACFU53_12890 [Streptomyces sp. NPDC057474]|uniref:hypothetical protein n=1 Tax=Streptomyces sp. NPDC057474 TaxID=3346144 RepID=UPI003679A7DE